MDVNRYGLYCEDTSRLRKISYVRSSVFSLCWKDIIYLSASPNLRNCPPFFRDRIDRITSIKKKKKSKLHHKNTRTRVPLPTPLYPHSEPPKLWLLSSLCWPSKDTPPDTQHSRRWVNTDHHTFSLFWHTTYVHHHQHLPLGKCCLCSRITSLPQKGLLCLFSLLLLLLLRFTVPLEKPLQLPTLLRTQVFYLPPFLTWHVLKVILIIIINHGSTDVDEFCDPSRRRTRFFHRGPCLFDAGRLAACVGCRHAVGHDIRPHTTTAPTGLSCHCIGTQISRRRRFGHGLG